MPTHVPARGPARLDWPRAAPRRTAARAPSGPPCASGRSPPSAAFPDPVLGLPAPPFPLPGLEAHFHSSASANGRCLGQPGPRRGRSAPGRLPACSQAGQRAFLPLPGAQQLGALSSRLWLALGWGRGPITGGQWGAQQVSPGMAQGLHGSLRSQEECLPRPGPVPPNARPPLETPDIPGRAEGTTRVRTPWGPRPGRGAPSTPEHRWTCRTNAGLGGRQARVRPPSRPSPAGRVWGLGFRLGASPGRTQPALTPAWQALLRLRKQPRTNSGYGVLSGNGALG